MIPIHPQIHENLDLIIQEAEKLGIDCIKEDSVYSLKKLGSKKQDLQSYDHYDAVSGLVYLIGGKKEDGSPFVALFFGGNGSRWFKTSPIIGCIKMGSKIEIETKNSYYLMSLDK